MSQSPILRDREGNTPGLLRDREGNTLGLLRDREGNTLVELAFVLPVFFTVVFGFIYFALIVFQLSNSTYAARTAARYACLHSTANAQPTSTQTLDAIVSPMLLSYPANVANIALSYSNGNTVGSTAIVTITLQFQAGIAFTTRASGVVTQ